jgi:hypothetical protein
MNRYTGPENVADDPFSRKARGGYINMGDVVKRDVEPDQIANTFIQFMHDKLQINGLYYDKTNKLQNIIKIKSTNGSLKFMSDAHTSAIKKRFPGTSIFIADGVEFDVPYTSTILNESGEECEVNISGISFAQPPMTGFGLVIELGRIMLFLHFINVLINQIWL